jgi:DNA invertase Pin-like site-specific DNA recombinase
MLAGPPLGMYGPSGPGSLLFAFFSAMAEPERENIRESTLEGLDTPARKGRHGGRPHRRHAALGYDVSSTRHCDGRSARACAMDQARLSRAAIPWPTSK